MLHLLLTILHLKWTMLHLKWTILHFSFGRDAACKYHKAARAQIKVPFMLPDTAVFQSLHMILISGR